MDRSYKSADTVNVYLSPLAKKMETPIKQVKSVPYSMYGMEYYKVDSVMYPGYRDELNGADACIFITEPLIKGA